MTLLFRGVDRLDAPSGTRVAHLSDLHIGKGREPDEKTVFCHVLRVIADLAVDLIVVSGDLVHVPEDVVSLDWVRLQLEESQIPWTVVPGNHDIQRPDQSDEFSRRFGEYPRFETHAGLGVALFDSFCGLTFDERDEREMELYRERGYLAHGAIRGDDYEILAKQLEMPWIAVVHHHLHDELEDADNPLMAPLRGSESFLAWCESFGAAAVLHGHKHAPLGVRRHGEMAVFRGAATTKVPTHFRLLDIGSSVAWHEISIEMG